MARMSEIKFGDLQVDERYKKLKRDLKLASLRKENNKQPDKSILSSLPNISNINIDSTNSITNTSILHTSEVDNDLVSSSKNLRGILPKNRFWRQSDFKKDCLTMQPPNSHIVPRTFKTPKNTVMCNGKSLPSENKYISSFIEFTKRKSSFIPSDIIKQCTNTITSLQSDSDNVNIIIQSRKTEVFTKWKVMLTQQGQLVIKGMLQCKKIVQSKPVIRRLTSNSVESVCKDLYYLRGNIVDDEHELPEYVKGKFYNGFPDDWENVHQIWRMFVQQGCRVSFRWPTPIADSDDDLKSEVTDVTYLYTKNPKYQVSDLEYSKKPQTSRMSSHSDYSFDVSQKEENDKTFSVQGCEKRNSCTQTSICGITENSFYNIHTQSPSNQYACNTECDKKQENTNLEYFKDNDKLKSKFNVILNNLLDKNCPKKCITEIIEIIECLNYVVLHKSIEDNESSMDDINPGNYGSEQSREISNESGKLDSISLIKGAKYNKNMCHNLTEQHKYTAREEDKIAGNKIRDGGKSLQKKRTFTEMNKDNDSDSFESESEIYTGIPRIPVDLLLRRRKGLMKPYKRKIRKKEVHQKCSVMSKQPVSNVSSAENCVNETGSKRMNSIHLNDSNITKYKRCFSKARNRDIYPYVSNKIANPIDFNIAKEEQWSELNDLNKDKNMQKVQKSFLSGSSTSIQRSINNFYNSFDRMKNRELESTSTENYAKSETNNQLQNYAHCKPSKEFLYQFKNDTSKSAKPAIISSVPINIGVTDLKSKYLLRKSRTSIVKNENQNIEELNKENKYNSSMQTKKLPTKFHAARNGNSTLLSDSKKNIEKHVQLDSADSTSIKMSTQANLEMVKGNQQDTSRHKPKLLVGWVPKILGDSELSLILEGTLLNDAGHIVRKKFRTDSVLRRISPKLIETVRHELYQLIGDLKDTKHVIPKQLINQCRYGCPRRINQFCREWKLLQNSNDANPRDIMENLNDTLASTVNLGVSSKGRRIIRPLNYWIGERYIIKDDNPVYSPGNPLESDQNKSIKALKTSVNNIKSSSDESEFTERTVNKTASNRKKIASRKFKKSLSKHTRTNVKMQESNRSSDSENFSPPKKYRIGATKQTSLDPVNVTTKQNAHSTGVENSRVSYTRLDETKSMKKSTKTNENTGLNSSKRMSMNEESSAGKYSDVVCSFFRDIPFKDDTLSEDQESHI